MTQRTKLLLLIPHLGGGGAERIAAQLTRHLDRQRFEIHLCLITEDAPGAQPPPDWIHVHRLGFKRVRQAWWRMIGLIRSERPEVMLSGMAHLNFLLLLLKPFLPGHTRILVRQNTTASSASKAWLSRLPYRYLYPRADGIICQSQAMATDLASHFAISRDKLTVLANPIDLRVIQTNGSAWKPHHDGLTSWPPSASPRLIAVGRLAHEKGMDLLLHAIGTVRQQYPRIHLTILGIGPEEAALRNLAENLKLETAVTFAGYAENPADYYATATLFVLPSRYEGLPNALLEAAAAGLPLVATPCCSGVADLLQDAPGTWLTPAISAQSLAETVHIALAAIWHAPHASEDPPQRFNHAFLAPFEATTAIAAYAALIEHTAAQRNR
jgi:glycosyltransferase involved in cell wall biosynthesis